MRTNAACVVGVDLAHVTIAHLLNQRHFAAIALTKFGPMNASVATGALEWIGSIVAFAEVQCVIIATTASAIVRTEASTYSWK